MNELYQHLQELSGRIYEDDEEEKKFATCHRRWRIWGELKESKRARSYFIQKHAIHHRKWLWKRSKSLKLFNGLWCMHKEWMSEWMGVEIVSDYRIHPSSPPFLISGVISSSFFCWCTWLSWVNFSFNSLEEVFDWNCFIIHVLFFLMKRVVNVWNLLL